MKQMLTLITLLFLFGTGVSQAQAVTDSWQWGFGGSYPRYYSSNITTSNTNYGFYLSGQRSFSEYVGLRLRGDYSHLEGTWSDAQFQTVVQSTNLITTSLDLIYYLVPCESVVPYLFAGIGANYKMQENNQTLPNDNTFGAQFNIGLGAEYKFSPSWHLVSEFGYHITSNSELDGSVVPTEVNGHDTYLALSLGVNFLFNQGPESKNCEPCCEQLPAGISKDMTDYKKIEEMIIKHIPKIITTEVVVDKYIYAIAEDRIVLVGVQFAFDKSELLPESYIVLDKSVKLLKDNPNFDVEIEGYTDYIGPDEYNYELSLQRALTVKNYLVSQGIDADRLSTVGYGKGNPVADNTTAEGRAMNRRIVFRIIR